MKLRRRRPPQSVELVDRVAVLPKPREVLRQNRRLVVERHGPALEQLPIQALDFRWGLLLASKKRAHDRNALRTFTTPRSMNTAAKV